MVFTVFAGTVACADPDPSEAGRPRGHQTFTLSFENDLFGDSDQQYTNGLKLSWLSPDLKRLEGAAGIPAGLLSVVQHLNAFERRVVDDTARQFNVGFALGQMIFTPEDTRSRLLVRNDRPYAGWFYGAIALVSKNARIADTLEIQAGMIGSALLAEEAQKFVHDLRDLPKPQGWDHQLENEPGLVIYYERKWRVIRASLIEQVETDLIAHAGAAIGNVMDYAAVGAELRLGWNLPQDFGTSLIRPGGDANAPSAVSNAGDPHDRLGLYGFAALGGRLVGRDIFLDGNTFADSHSVDKKPVVGDLVIGASVIFRAVKLSYAQVFRAREFDERHRRHNFGTVSLSVSF